MSLKLNDIATELQNGSYPNDDIAAWEQLRNVEITEYGCISAGVMGAFLSKNLVYVRLQQLAKRTDPLYDSNEVSETVKTAIHNSAASTYDRILSGRVFDFSDSDIRQGVLDFKEIGFFNQTQADSLLAKAEIKVNPFQSVSLRQVKMAKGTCEPAKTIEWNRQKYLKITLNEDLPEVTNPYLSKTTNVFFDDHPVSRTTTKPMFKAGTYTVDLTGVESEGVLKVALDISDNFELEFI